MKHVTATEKSMLMGDEAADTLVHYAAHLARIGSGDSVELRVLNVDGSEVVATFLLNSGTALMVESTAAVIEEPDNTDAVAYMIAQMGQFDISGEGFDQAALTDER